MGSTGMAGLAREIDIGAQTLKGFLEGGDVYAKSLAKIEAYLARSGEAGL
jgi:DNA transposition AAA+ family ATPase